MSNRIALLLALLAAAGCFGTEIGNPDGNTAPGEAGRGGGGGTDSGIGGAGGVPDFVDIAPDSVDFGQVCQGGLSRRWITLQNSTPTPLQFRFAPDPRVSASPSDLLVDARGSRAVGLVFGPSTPVGPPPDPGHGDGWDTLEGSLRVTMTLESGEEVLTDSVGWTVSGNGPTRQASLLCGGEGPCQGISFEADEAMEITAEFSVANDGCEPFLLLDLDIQGDGGLAPSWLGDGLPIWLEPGARWSGFLVFPGGTERMSGTVGALIEDLEVQPVPWELIPPFALDTATP